MKASIMMYVYRLCVSATDARELPHHVCNLAFGHYSLTMVSVPFSGYLVYILFFDVYIVNKSGTKIRNDTAEPQEVCMLIAEQIRFEWC